MKHGKVRDPADWDLDMLIETVGGLGDVERTGALAVLAHHLTVEVRVALDEPFPHPCLSQVRELNEFLHHLTSRLFPDERRSADDDKSLLRAFAVDAVRAGLEKGLKRGLVIAVRSAPTGAKRPIPAL